MQTNEGPSVHTTHQRPKEKQITNQIGRLTQRAGWNRWNKRKFRLFHNSHKNGHEHIPPVAAAQPSQRAALAVDRAEAIPSTHSPLPIPLIHPIPCPLLRQGTVQRAGDMENRNIRCGNGKSVICEGQSEEAVHETSLSREELHSLIQFFQLLDQWDRELVQNTSENESR